MQHSTAEGGPDLAAIWYNIGAELGDLQRLYSTPADSVEDFPAPRTDPLCYPGMHPEHAFTTSEGNVWPMRVTETNAGVQFTVATAEGVFDLDDALRFYGVEAMENRFPIVGFGSNACPGQLNEKFSEAQDSHGDIANPNDRHIIPTLRGAIKDVAAVYSSKLGIHGYVFAELVRAMGAESEVFVNFLSEDQLKRMIRTEGAYELCELGEVSIDGLSRPIAAFGFVGKNGVLLDAAGKPILLESAKTSGVDWPAMTEEQVLEALAREFGPQLDARYPRAPFFANSASNLMAYSSYRLEYLRRKPTISALYKHPPAEGAQPDEMIGTALQTILVSAGRVSERKLLDDLSPEQRVAQPRTFGELWLQNSR